MGGKCAHQTIQLFDGKTVKYESCMIELTSQVAIQAYTLFILNIVELGVPYIKSKLLGIKVDS